MNTQIFLNLSVKNLPKSIEFFTKLGYTFNPMFTDETSTCMIISENIFAMLLTEEKFKMFTKKEITDTSKSTEVLICLSAESKEAVDELVNKAINAGGKTPMPKQDHGFMYAHGFEDLDGHTWEIMWMDIDSFPKQ